MHRGKPIYLSAFEKENNNMKNYSVIEPKQFLLDSEPRYSITRVVDPNVQDPVLTNVIYQSGDIPGLVPCRPYFDPIPYIKLDRETRPVIPLDEVEDLLPKLQLELAYYVQTWSGIIQFDKCQDARLSVMAEMDVYTPGLTITETLRAPDFRDFYKPMLQTPEQIPYFDEQHSVVYGLQARNGVTYDMSNVVEHSKLAFEIMHEFFEAFQVRTEELNLFGMHPIYLSEVDMWSWLSCQPPEKKEVLRENADFKYFLDLSNDYLVELKRSAKHDPTFIGAQIKNAPQVIVHQQRTNNVIECSMSKNFKTRFLSVLGPNIFVYTDCSPEEFAELLTLKLPQNLLEDYVSLELDLAKFDKSQRRLALMIEVHFMLVFGYPIDFVIAWIIKHNVSVLRSIKAMVKLVIEMQRRSGDAWTYIGNTIHNGCVLAHCFGPMLLRQCIVLISGDDSVVFIPKKLYDPTLVSNISNTAAAVFGLEAKVIHNKRYINFCSRFLLNLDGIWHFVPDPLKVAIRMGRNDIVSDEHVEEIWISLRDNLKSMDNKMLLEDLAAACQEHHKLPSLPIMLIIYVVNMSRNFEEFKELYFKHPDDEYRVISTLPSLKN